MVGTIPTKNPVPSKDIRDLGFNSEKIDEVVNSSEHTYQDRMGNAHYTIEGINNLSRQAMVNYGYIPKRSFEEGNEIVNPNDVLFFEYDKCYYRWDGELPKTVIAGSSPDSTGGVGRGAWVNMVDALAISALTHHEIDDNAHAELFDKIHEDIDASSQQARKELIEHNENPNAHPSLKSYIATEVNRIDDALNTFMQTSLGSSRIFANTADGLAETTIGQHFLVKGTPPAFADMYLNKAGTAEYINSMSDTSALEGSNIMPDPTFNVISKTSGWYKNRNVFSYGSRNVEFFKESALDIKTGTTLFKADGELSISYPKSDIILLPLKRLFVSTLVRGTGAIKVTLNFRNGDSVIKTTPVNQPETSRATVYVSSEIPSEPFTAVEVHFKCDSDLEVGYITASYGTYADSALIEEFIGESAGVNLLYDAWNEISSVVPDGIYDWYDRANKVAKSFKYNEFTGRNSLYISSSPVSKLYNLEDRTIKANSLVYFSCLVASTGKVKIMVELLSKNLTVIGKMETTVQGNESVELSHYVVNFDVNKLRITLTPESQVIAYANGWYLGYSPIVTRESGYIPDQYRGFMSESLPQNLVPDSHNELSINGYAEHWFSGIYSFSDIGASGLNNVAVIDKKGRMTKRYDLTNSGITAGSIVTVGASVYANKDGGTSRFYVQFRNSKGEIINAVRSKLLSAGLDETLFQYAIEETPAYINFIIDNSEDGLVVEATNFYVGSIMPRGNSGQLPISVIKDVVGSVDPTPESSVLPTMNNNALINYHFKSTKLQLDEWTTISVGFIGDSWTHMASRYVEPLTKLITKELKDAGSGWTGFGFVQSGSYVGVNGNARPEDYVLNYGDISKWNLSASHYKTAASPDLCACSSDIVGASLSLTGNSRVVSAKLIYLKTEGIFKYRFGGDWVTVDASTGAEVGIINIPELPPTGQWKFELEVVSGVVTVCGIDIRSENKGVIVHKLGASGSNTRDWTSVSEAQYVAATSALNLDTAFILLGTNDQSALTPEAYEENLRVMVNRLRLSNSAMDIVLVCPCENMRNNTVSMSKFSDKMRLVATSLNTGFIDLQTDFGVKPSDYSSSAKRPLFNPDGIHPEPLTGGRAIVSALTRFIDM
ncbi:TPA: GDSL-type esterase/lipase family protein [Providencia stuartii]